MRRVLVPISLGLALLAVPLAAARAAPRFVLLVPGAFVAPPADSAALYVAREQFVRARPLSPEETYLDGAPLGLLPQRSFVAAVVAPGRHCLSGLAGMPPFCLECRAGRGYLLRLRETIDDQDRRLMDWLLDDPARIETLAGAFPLQLAVTTPKGLRSMKEGSRAGGAADARAAPDTLPLVLEGMWFEDPLRPETAKPSFRRDLCRVTVDSGGVLVTSEQHALPVPIAAVTGIRFGGVRGNSNQPWLDVEFRLAGALQVASFADSRLETSVANYNRLFTVLRDLWLARGGNAPDSGASSGGDSAP